MVKDQVDKMIAAAAAALEETDAEMLERLNAEMVADYEVIKRSEH